jgi:hypothetical protein
MHARGSRLFLELNLAPATALATKKISLLQRGKGTHLLGSLFFLFVV